MDNSGSTPGRTMMIMFGLKTPQLISTVGLLGPPHKVSFCVRSFFNATFLGSMCVDTSAPDGSLRSTRCDQERNFLCEIDANTNFCSMTGVLIYKLLAGDFLNAQIWFFQEIISLQQTILSSILMVMIRLIHQWFRVDIESLKNIFRNGNCR